MGLSIAHKDVRNRFSNIFPPRLLQYFLTFAIISLISILVIIPSKIPIGFFLFNIITCTLFAIFILLISRTSSRINSRAFISLVFWLNIIIGTLTVIALYYFFYKVNGEPFEFEARDSKTYHQIGIEIANLIGNKNFNISHVIPYKDYSDYGAPVITGILYFLFGKHVLVFRIFNVLISCITVILIYKLTKLIHNNETTARLAAIIWTFLPIIHMHSAFNLKESFLIFLTVSFLYNSAKVIILKRISIKSFLLLLMVGFSILFFRSSLLVALLAGLFLGLLLRKGHRIRNFITFLILIGLSMYLFSSSIFVGEFKEQYENSPGYFDRAIEYRAERAKNISSFNIGRTFVLGILAPIPNVITTDKKTQLLFTSSHFIKAFLMFFFFASIYYLYKDNRLLNHSFLLSYWLIYILFLTITFFVIYVRFQLLLYPIIVIYAANGIYIINNRKRFSVLQLYLVGYFIVFLLWNTIR